ncbi:hypothetical protein ACFLQW_03235 [Candidatus Zixiibacteriota bacterium]
MYFYIVWPFLLIDDQCTIEITITDKNSGNVVITKSILVEAALITGIWDRAIITNGPTVIRPGDKVKFDAEFHDFDVPYGTYVVSWTWWMDLHQVNGKAYRLASGTSGGSSGTTWEPTVSSSLPSYEWFRATHYAYASVHVGAQTNDGTWGVRDVWNINFGAFPTPPYAVITEELANIVALQFSTGGGTSFMVHYGTTPGPPYDGTGLPQGDSPIDVGEATSLVLDSLNKDVRHYFAVTAINEEGESDYSNQVSIGGPAIPTLSEWGMIILFAVLAAGIVWFVIRWRTAQATV